HSDVTRDVGERQFAVGANLYGPGLTISLFFAPLLVARHADHLHAVADDGADSLGQRLGAGRRYRRRKRGERKACDDNLSHGLSVIRYDLFKPSTICAAPAELPLRISFINAIVSCSNATLRRSASKRLSRAAALNGSDRTASRLSAIA